MVMVRDGLDAFGRHAAATQNVGEKRARVGRPLGAAKEMIRTASNGCDKAAGLPRPPAAPAATVRCRPLTMPSTPPPAASSPARLPWPVWTLGWVSFFTDVASEAIYALLPAFLRSVLGAGAIALGIIEGLAEATASLLKIVSGGLSDRWRVRKPIVLAGYSLSSLVRPLMALATAWPQVLAIRFLDRTGKGIRGAPRDAMLTYLSTPETRGRVFGVNRMMDHAGAVAGPLLATGFLLLYPGQYLAFFALTAIPGVFVVLLLLRLPEVGEEPRAPDSPHPGMAPSWRALPADFFRLQAILLLFTLGNSTDAFLLLRLGDIGIPTA